MVEIGRKYTEALKKIDGVVNRFIEGHDASVFSQYIIQVENREAVQAKLKETYILCLLSNPP